MSVALDLDVDSLFAPQPAPVRRPSLRVVPCEPTPDRSPRTPVRSEPAASVTVLHAPSPASITSPLRLTGRGAAVLAALTAVAGGLLVWAAVASAPDAAASGSADTGTAATATTITVQPGDTLWALASRVAPGRDPRAEVAQLRRLNHLADPGVMPGQVLRVR